jgi:hypothetical protein
MKLLYKTIQHTKRMLEFWKKEKIEATSCDVDGGGSLGFCLFLLVSACSYF